MRCKVCKVKFEPKYFLQKTCTEPTCVIEYGRLNAKKAEEKIKKLEEKEWQERKKQIKEKLKKLSEYEAEAKLEFQAWVRERDKELPCISCGITNPKEWHGGHFKKAEIYSGVIFSEENVNKQCSKCNVFLGGNELMYRDGLVKKIGLQQVEALEKLANDTRLYKWTKEQLIEIKEEYKWKLKELRKFNK